MIPNPLRHLALLLCFVVGGCASLGHPPSSSSNDTVAGITINRTGHPIVLPLRSLSGATFIGTNGELIIYPDKRGLYATIFTVEEWGGSSPIPMNTVPQRIFERHTDDLENDAFRRELEGIIRITLEPADRKKMIIRHLGNVTAYIIYNPEKSIIMLTSPDKPDFYSYVVLDGFTWESIETDILGGLQSRHLKSGIVQTDR